MPYENPIEVRLGKCGGNPVLKSTRIPLSILVDYYQEGYTREEFADLFDLPIELAQAAYNVLEKYVDKNEGIPCTIVDEKADIETRTGIEGVNCARCGVGTYAAGRFTRTIETDDMALVIRDVPGSVCDACGETVINANTREQLDAITKEALLKGVQVLVRSF